MPPLAVLLRGVVNCTSAAGSCPHSPTALEAPNAKLVLGASSPTVFTGQFIAKTISTQPDTKVVF